MPRLAYKDDRKALERSVDAHGLEQTLLLLSEVCTEKGRHIAANWSDGNLADMWHSASRALVAAGATRPIRGLTEFEARCDAYVVITDDKGAANEST